MLNYEQVSNIIEMIKKDVSIYNNNQQQAKLAYEAIFNYLNHAGGHTLVPQQLKPYINTLSIFQNPYEILAAIKKQFPEYEYFDEQTVKQEIQTIALLWLREASSIPIKDIDLHIIYNQCHSMH